MKKSQLDTPCLVIDRNKLMANLHTMHQEVSQRHKNLRPHIKTHKCTKLAKLQIEHGGAIGVCAAKLGEAEKLVEAKIAGILITSPIVTTIKIERLMQCLKHDTTIMVVVDSEQNASDLNTAAKANNLFLQVLVDIDPGTGRTGTRYENAVNLGDFINKLSNLKLKGIQCYAGNLQHISDFKTRSDATLTAMQKAVEVLKKFKQLNLPCEILTGSGTGTYDIDLAIPEITEVQPGSYTVMDMEYRLIGSKAHPTFFDKYLPAMTMLVSVISANHDTHVTVDAGTKALYFDPMTKPKIISHPNCEYDWAGFGDEHGKVKTNHKSVLPKLGEKLELIVPHCDPTINLFDRIYVTEDDDVVDIWDIDMRGRSQ